MLFGYPVAATEDNWLHVALCEAVGSIHELIDSGKRYPAWPSVLPRAVRKKLKGRYGLRDRLKAYDRAVRSVTKADRDVLLDALDSQNRIAELVSGARPCVTLAGLPNPVCESIEALFGFAFGLLADLALRDNQYSAIYAAIPDHMCPFCGTEYFDAPGAAREALDHYLARSRYPFASANLRNLVPMGNKCNSSYKLATDLLVRADGSRRVAFDPYNHASLSMSLNESELFADPDDWTPRWEIEFVPDSPEVATWDEVFSVRERFVRDHLNPSFRSWLDQFGKLAKREALRPDSGAAVAAALKRFEDNAADCGFQDRGFLKAAVFRMLRLRCEAGNTRLAAALADLAGGAIATVDEVREEAEAP